MTTTAVSEAETLLREEFRTIGAPPSAMFEAYVRSLTAVLNERDAARAKLGQLVDAVNDYVGVNERHPGAMIRRADVAWRLRKILHPSTGGPRL